jgi:hypothetical protein
MEISQLQLVNFFYVIEELRYEYFRFVNRPNGNLAPDYI